MGDSINFDFSDVVQLAADLGNAPEKSGPYIRKAVEVNARKVRDTWRKKASGSASAPAFPYSISYDLKGGLAIRGASIDAEVGPDKSRRQGALGNLIEYGSVNNAPRGYGAASLEENQEDLVQGLQKAVDDGLRDVGL